MQRGSQNCKHLFSLLTLKFSAVDQLEIIVRYVNVDWINEIYVGHGERGIEGGITHPSIADADRRLDRWVS